MNRNTGQRRDPKASADYIGVSVEWMQRARIGGFGPRFLKIGRLVRYDVRDLDEYLAGARRTSTSDPGDHAAASAAA